MENTQTEIENEPNPMKGHNLPPQTPEEVLSAQEKDLEINNQELVKRKNDLLDAVKRMPKDIGVDDDTLAGKVADQIKLMKKCAVEAQKAKDAGKKPYLDAGAVVQKFFVHDIETPLRDKAKDVEKVLTAWQNKVAERNAKIAREKAAEDARIAKEAADKATAEAERLAKEAEDSEDLDAAIDAEEAAEEAALMAGDAEEVAAQVETQAPDVRNNEKIDATYGARLSSGKRIVHEIKRFRIVDLEALRPYITPDMIDMAVRAHIKAHGNDLAKIPHIKGITIFKEEKTKVI